jgi:hypothetical protein
VCETPNCGVVVVHPLGNTYEAMMEADIACMLHSLASKHRDEKRLN